MKILKKQGLTLILILALVVTLTLGIVLLMPARTASAEVTPQTVSDGAELQRLIEAAGSEEVVFKLNSDVVLEGIRRPDETYSDEFFYAGLVIERGQNITIDLAGHVLSTKLRDGASGTIFYNWGKLSVIDSSANRTGKAVSNGAIDLWGSPTWYAPSNIILNHGDLTLDAQIEIAIPKSSAAGEEGYYQDTSYNAPDYFVRNELMFPTEDDPTVYPVSLTINGGKFDLNTAAGIVDRFFILVEADLTVNGGTFINSSTTKPSNGGFLAQLMSLKKNSKYESQIEQYRHVDITINGGDFRGDSLLTAFPALLYFLTSPAQKYDTSIKGEGYSVLISGGTFPMDLSAYTDVDHMMIKETITQNEGETEVESYWVVVEADTTNFGAAIMQNGVIVQYCQSFEDAWEASKLISGNSTIVLYRDASVSHTLKFAHAEKDTTLDLNGYNLTVTPPANISSTTNEYHFYRDYSSAGSKRYYGKFIIQDNSETQDGELVLVYQENSKIGGFNLSASYQVILESGTIHVSGAIPGPVESKADYQPTVFVFPLIDNIWKEDAVVINGGNIISDFSADAVKIAAWEDDSLENDYTDDILSPNEMQKASLKIADPELATNLDDYLEACGGMKFTWDLRNFVGQDLETTNYEWVEINTGYVFLKAAEVANYYAANGTYSTFADALAAVQSVDEKSISALNDVTEESGITIPDGVTLNLSKYLNYTLTGVVTLQGGTLLNGTVDGPVTVSGAAKISNAKLKQTLTVTESGVLDLHDGTYDGNITVNEGGKLTIYGGRFAQGTDLESYDNYIYPGFGATDANGGYRTVKPGIPSLAALEWYGKGVAKTSARGYGIMAIDETPKTYTINSTADWLYFSSIVNSGTDSFADDTVVLGTENLDFGGKIFLTAGIHGAPFKGTFEGGGNVISNVDAHELSIGLFGVTGSGCKVNQLTILDSVFKAGSGYFDEANQAIGYLAAGSVVGDGYLGESEGIKIKHDRIEQEGSGRSFLGAIIGHTYSSVSLKDPEITDSTSVQLNWKSGGIVGYVEGGLTLTGGTISDLEFSGKSNWYPGGVLAGDLNSKSATVTDAKIDCPDLDLVGRSSVGSDLSINGSETDIHVGSLGSVGGNGNFDITLDKEGEKSAQLQVGSELPGNVTIKDGAGGEITPEANPDGDGFILQADPQKVELFRDKVEGEEAIGELVGSYATLEDALEMAQDGDRLYLKASTEEDVTVNKNVTINLYKNTLTGTIVVEGTLTLENGNVTSADGTATVQVSGGTLSLERGDGLTIENTGSGAAIEGDYAVLNDACVVKHTSGEVVNKIELNAEHAYTTYEAVGAVITITCANCGKEYGRVTLTAKDALTYTGTALEDVVAVESTLPEDSGIVLPALSYTWSATQDGDFAPTTSIGKAGHYRASLTLESATATVEFVVGKGLATISGITAITGYNGQSSYTGAAQDADITLPNGEVKKASELGLTVTVTAELSAYQVGKQVAKLVAIEVTGDALADFDISLVGNQAFMEVDVTAAMLTVRVNGDGSVSYEGFVGGENESVLGGSLKLSYVDNGDGTTTVTPSGLVSDNYHIVYVSGTVATSSIEGSPSTGAVEGGMTPSTSTETGANGGSLALWISIGAAAVVLLGAGVVVFALRRKHE